MRAPGAGCASTVTTATSTAAGGRRWTWDSPITSTGTWSGTRASSTTGRKTAWSRSGTRGSTRAWGTDANTEAKYLLLRHAFEDEGYLRVEFKTDALNERSRPALEKVGAAFEGVA